MVKLFPTAGLVEMGALEPLGERIDAWKGKADLLDNLLELNKGPDGQQCYLPIRYVVLYLYYRTDLFRAAGLKPPTTCEEFRDDAIKLADEGTGYLRLPDCVAVRADGTSGALSSCRKALN